MADKIPNFSNSKLLRNQTKKPHKVSTLFSFACISTSLPIIITEQCPETITELDAPTLLLSVMEALCRKKDPKIATAPKTQSRSKDQNKDKASSE